MHYNGMKLQRINLNTLEHPRALIDKSRLIFSCGKLIKRYRLASLCVTGINQRYIIQIDDEQGADQEQFAASIADSGLFIEMQPGAEAFGKTFKPGIYEIGSFLNFCHLKKVRGNENDKWVRLSSTLRAIRHSYRWLEPGVYEAVEEKYSAAQESKMVPNREILRRLDRAEGALTEAESWLLRKKVDQRVAQALRTETIDRSKLLTAVNALYNGFGLQSPKLVVVSSPLAASVVGCFATALCHAQQTPASSPVDHSQLSVKDMNKSLFCEMYNLSVQTARYATEAAIDSAMETNIARALQESTFSMFGTATATQMVFSGALLSEQEKSALESSIVAATRAITGQGQDQGNAHSQSTMKGAAKRRAQTRNDTTESDKKRSAVMALAKQAAHSLCPDEDVRDLMLRCVEEGNHIIKGGNMESIWDSQIGLCRDVLKLQLPSHKLYELWDRAATEGGVRLFHEKFCIVSDFPETLQVDDQLRLHCEHGPAIQWRDGWSLYYWHGIPVSRQLIEFPETLTLEQLNSERNIEIRRIMIERYGQARYLVDSGAQEIQRDDCGILYQKQIRGDEPLTMVKVINSTSEPDGTFKEYFIRTPPHLTSARAAVAWTFAMRPEEYNPSLQT